ncbi:MAG: hypothetical protein WAN03_06935 [Candidatus Sulfotelmatobacter sp.]
METQIRKGEKSGGLAELPSGVGDEIRFELIATHSVLEAIATCTTNGFGL